MVVGFVDSFGRNLSSARFTSAVRESRYFARSNAPVRLAPARVAVSDMRGVLTGEKFNVQCPLTSHATFEARANGRFIQILADEHHLAHTPFARIPKAVRRGIEQHLHALHDDSFPNALDVQHAFAAVNALARFL